MTYGRDDRSDTERSNQKTLTLDDSALASHPGGVRVSLVRWSLRYPKWPVILVGALLLSVGLSVTVDWMFVVSLPLALIPNFFYWNRVREHFRYGDANPGLIVGTDPVRIAVLTDMTKGEGSYPLLRISEDKPAAQWGSPVTPGTRVATVGLYGVGHDERAPRWESFEPWTVEPVAADVDQAIALLDGFEPEQWERLERAVAQIGQRSEGSYPVDEEGASWRDSAVSA